MSGALLERLGRAQEALADFTRAIQLGSGALSHNARCAALPSQQQCAFQPSCKESYSCLQYAPGACCWSASASPQMQRQTLMQLLHWSPPAQPF